jgi:hypothetical protein
MPTDNQDKCANPERRQATMHPVSTFVPQAVDLRAISSTFRKYGAAVEVSGGAGMDRRQIGSIYEYRHIAPKL